MTLFTDRVQSTVERALDGTALRQKVTADNIANAMTPGYRAKRVDFEASLSSALKAGRPGEATVAVRDSGYAARIDGNSVRIEDEVQDQMKTGLTYQALVEAANHKLGLLRTAIEGR